MPKDQIYDQPIDPVPPFEFDEAVVRVFDDMLTRSIPLYGEIIKRQAQLIDRYYQADTRIYDLGCSNGNLGLEICRVLGRRPFDMAAVDRSEPMIKAYAERLDNLPHSGRIELLCRDMGTLEMERASAVIMNFTLQFIAHDEFGRLAGLPLAVANFGDPPRR